MKSLGLAAKINETLKRATEITGPAVLWAVQHSSTIAN